MTKVQKMAKYLHDHFCEKSHQGPNEDNSNERCYYLEGEEGWVSFWESQAADLVKNCLPESLETL